MASPAAPQYMFVFFMILRNSASLTSPSPSLSASSIISCKQTQCHYCNVLSLYKQTIALLPVQYTQTRLQCCLHRHHTAVRKDGCVITDE